MAGELIYIENLVNISQKIEKLVQAHGIDYIDACLLYCDQNGVETEQLADIIKKNPNIKGKLQGEAEQLNFIKKTSRIVL